MFLAGSQLSVPLLLWRGELRVQGLLLRRWFVTLGQTLVFAGFFVIVVLQVRNALTIGGPVRTLNVAVITACLVMLMAANVTLLGERTGTLPWQLQRWAASLPLSPTQVARLIVAFSVLRSGLLTLALLAAVAIGAITAANSPISMVIILVSALLLPLLPVALGLQWARRRGTSVSIAFTFVPLVPATAAITTPLPLASGWVETVLGWVALPAMVLVGRVGLGEASVFLAAWTGVALVLLRPAALSLKDDEVKRGFGSLIWRLGRVPASPRRWSLALDIALHRVRPADLLEILFLGAVSCSVVALQTFDKTSLGGLSMAAAVSAAAAIATVAGYLHMRSTVQTDPAAEGWIRTLPVSACALSLARHGVCAAGALLAVLPVMALTIVRSGGPGEPAALALASWAGLSVWAFTGWLAVLLSARGGRRIVMRYLMFAGYGVRSALSAAVLSVWSRPVLVGALFAADLAVGWIGQWRGAFAASRERPL